MKAEEKTFLLSISSVKNKDFLNVYGFDITERKQAEDTVREQSRFLQLIIDSLPNPVYYKDPSGKYLGCNEALGCFTGLSKQEIIGKTIFDVAPNKETANIHHQMDLEVSKNGGIQSYESSVVFSDGTRHDAIFYKAAFQNPDRSFGGIVGTITDITERKLAQQAIHQTEKLSSLGTLAAGVAHEILNPLNNIEALVQMMRVEEQTEETKHDLEEIMGQIRRASKITNNLRMFAKPKKSEFTLVDVNTLFNNTAVLIERNLQQDNILIERDLDETLPPITADEDVLAQIFLNLLNNSRDAMVGIEGNRISIKTEREGKGIQITLSDNGPGIPKDIIGKIFDPFFSTKDPGKGTGLGLSILHSSIEEHGGTVRVKSEEGRGATFIIWLPLKS